MIFKMKLKKIEINKEKTNKYIWKDTANNGRSVRVAPLLIPGHNFHSTNHWGAMATSCSVALHLWKCKNNFAKTQKFTNTRIYTWLCATSLESSTQKGIQSCKFQSRLLNRWNCCQKSLSENWDMRSGIALIVFFVL